MPTLAIESNGRIEKTAVYYNGEQIGGIKELMISIDEDGTNDAVIQYEGTNGEIFTKRIFEEYLTDVKVVEPSFTEEDAQELHLLEIQSDGNIENTTVGFDKEELNGIVSMFVHIKGSAKTKSGLKSLFTKRELSDTPEFKAEITFRNEDETLETESVF